MATRGRIQREEEAKTLEGPQGRVHSWRKVALPSGRSLSAKKLILKRWRQQGEAS